MTRTGRAGWALAFAAATAACSADDTSGTGATGASGATTAAGTGGATSGSGTATTTGAGGSAATGTGGGSTGSGGGAPTADDLLALVAACNTVSNGDYATDDGGAPAVPICGLTGAVFWTADMDIDCDGKQSQECNLGTDPAYLPETSATDSNGEFLDAATLPFVVVPLPSARFDYAAAGLALGSVIAVIYDGKVEYGVFGDEGPADIIGEASYAMASLLGIDPDPSFGGVDSGVTYVAFTGPGAVLDPIEDHAAATTKGQALAAMLLQGN